MITNNNKEKKIIALAGNPNVGKSTIFNKLTGLKQHTGNWAGKTVTNASGNFAYKSHQYILYDLPGIYSIEAQSKEEKVARDYICFGNYDAIVIVCDAVCLERNLNLVLQIIEITDKVIVCINLMDEAKKKKIKININKLAEKLGVPVVGTSARSGKGIKEIIEKVNDIIEGNIISNPTEVLYDEHIEKAIENVAESLENCKNCKLRSRFIALKLLDEESEMKKLIEDNLKNDFSKETILNEKLKEAHLLLKGEKFNQKKMKDTVVSSIFKKAEEISKEVVTYEKENYNDIDRKIDRIVTSKWIGIPIMLFMLAFIFWITIIGANYPSKMLFGLFSSIEGKLVIFFDLIKSPSWLSDILIFGIYRTVTWVVAVMLPPMAIFFPIFSLLEDFGYLPRVAFNLDKSLKKSCVCGKQALTMCMGFGCNAAGVVGCRIIDSPRERLIAIITNSFVPCNGRFPSIISIISIFFVGFQSGITTSLLNTMILFLVIMLGVYMTLIVSKLLSMTILKGMPSFFTLELPPYRKPQILKTITRSIFNKTFEVLKRAIYISAPFGAIIWIFSNVNIGNYSILEHTHTFLDPFARTIGLDGVILVGFLLGFPANEIVLPIVIMAYTTNNNLVEVSNLVELKELFINNNWTWVTAICFIIFSLMHFPCSTTCLTIKKETRSIKWMMVSILIPTFFGITLCFLVSNVAKILGLL